MWSETEHITWKSEVPGHGWSSPVVKGNQVWMTTATEGGLSLRAICVNRDSGRIAHNVEVFHRHKAIDIHPTNSFASPTPILEDDRVFVHFGTMGTACLDTRTAEIVWTNEELQWDHQVGPGSSPALYRQLLLFSCDGIDVQFGAALNKDSGRLVWKTNRSGVLGNAPNQKKAFVTPLIIHVADRDLAIMTAAEWAYAYDPLTGEEIWKLRHPGYSITPRPVYSHGLVYICTGFPRPELFAIRPEGQGDISATNIAWKVNQSVPTTPSPLLVDKELYLVSEVGVLSCLDAINGNLHFRKRVGGNFSASPIFVDGRIYLCNEQGITTVVDPGKSYQELAANQLDGHFMSSPAVAGKSFFMRSKTHLYRIDP